MMKEFNWNEYKRGAKIKARGKNIEILSVSYDKDIEDTPIISQMKETTGRGRKKKTDIVVCLHRENGMIYEHEEDRFDIVIDEEFKYGDDNSGQGAK